MAPIILNQFILRGPWRQIFYFILWAPWRQLFYFIFLYERYGSNYFNSICFMGAMASINLIYFILWVPWRQFFICILWASWLQLFNFILFYFILI